MKRAGLARAPVRFTTQVQPATLRAAAESVVEESLGAAGMAWLPMIDDIVGYTAGMCWCSSRYTGPLVTPIEDASIEWDSPYIKVGQLTISQRALTSPAEENEGNALLWNPWNAPASHRPLGSLMRVRRVVYPASGGHRGATHE